MRWMPWPLVDRMRCLKTLNISGDAASELRWQAEIFVRRYVLQGVTRDSADQCQATRVEEDR